MTLSDRRDDGPVIVWFRQDLRLTDNPALQAAMETERPVLCVYIRESGARYAGALGAAQAWWLHQSLAALNEALQATGNRLLLLSGDPLFALEHLVSTTGAQSVFWSRRYDRDGIRTDTEVKSILRQRGIEARSFAGFLMHEPARVLTRQGKPYSVFTPFWKSFQSQYDAPHCIPAPTCIPAPAVFPHSETLKEWQLLPSRPDWAKGFPSIWQPGEKGALARLAHFVDGRIDGYGNDRDLPGKCSTSGLSPHLALGEISPNQIWRATQAALESDHSEDVVHFRRELAWREFAWHLLFHKPDMPTTNLDRRFDSFAWQDDPDMLHRWQRGQTGYPIVDAGMRELWQTGFMQNRVRMIAASFLIKDLLVDWREGERWFRDTLLDVDRASNAMNWQWVAGCGADASPWFRIFNPVRQGQTFDADGAYVRRYCPELAAMADAFIHRPFEAPQSVLADAGVRLGHTYPRPIVAHDVARERALAAFQAIRTEER